MTNISVKRKVVLWFTLLFIFYLTKMHVPALCKQIVSDAATNGLLLHFGASVTNMQLLLVISAIIISNYVIISED